MSLADDVKSIALDCGFHAVGISDTEPFLYARKSLEERLRLGYLETTKYDSSSIPIYTDPRKAFPGARSLISVGLSYLTDEDNPPTDALTGRIARFSRGLDYHAVLNELLGVFSEELKKLLGDSVGIRTMADTGPMIDRPAATRSGIGSQGKNCCVYAGEYGSWVVLGELLIDTSLPQDSPAPSDICGNCDRCIRACPTGALCGPYTVDGRRCLSAITQSKGFMPVEFREMMGTHIYGCDFCQEVCPLNEGVTPGNLRHFEEAMGLGSDPEILPLLNISPAEFRSGIAPTTAGWIRRTRFRRNVAIALGNIGDPSAVDPLSLTLLDSEPILRGHAAWALGKIRTRDARSHLHKALDSETHPQVIIEIRAALEESG